jgi:hypothetical protein
MVYKTLEEAVVAAKIMCETLETYVRVTIAPEGNGYELFGTGSCVQTVKE